MYRCDLFRRGENSSLPMRVSFAKFCNLGKFWGRLSHFRFSIFLLESIVMCLQKSYVLSSKKSGLTELSFWRQIGRELWDFFMSPPYAHIQIISGRGYSVPCVRLWMEKYYLGQFFFFLAFLEKFTWNCVTNISSHKGSFPNFETTGWIGAHI